MPRRQHHQGQLGLVARRHQAQIFKFLERVKTVARLCVLEVAPRLNVEPEIGELVGETAALGAVHALEIALAHDQRTRMLLVGFQKLSNVGRIVLPIGIEGDGIGEAHRQSLLKAAAQGITLAAVDLVFNQGDALD